MSFIDELERDPYPTYAALRSQTPVRWMADLGAWWVTGYDEAREVLLDDTRFTTVSALSPVMDAFGAQMLSSDGVDHTRYRLVGQPAFTPKAVRSFHEALVETLATELIDALRPQGAADLRAAFASRLPVLVMSRGLGLPDRYEPQLRTWFDIFEARLANTAPSPDARRRASLAAEEFRALVGTHLGDAATTSPIRDAMRSAMSEGRMSAQEAERNLAIIFFGGISTVEALMLNTLWALYRHPAQLSWAKTEPCGLDAAIEETMRWLSPVQSATRFAVCDLTLNGVQIRASDKVSVMLASANRDPVAFEDPDRFEPARGDGRRHLGFAIGPHLCLGSHLARAQVAIALKVLFERLPDLAVDAHSVEPLGFEFRQPRRLWATWRTTSHPFGDPAAAEPRG